MKEKRKFRISFFPVGDSQKSKRVSWEVYAWFSDLSESRELVFSPSRSNLGLVSSRFAGFVRKREIYNLGMVSEPVLLKIKGTSWIFTFWGSNKQTKIETNMKKSVKVWSPEL